ncbi:MAG TPA: hypothetical protein DEO60_13150 [Bacteroidales bacterium]|jgi:hypothetical protein|nr:hypothetical protein [Bacteroidales bacterium]HBZ22072.1 hypothetical protein [Bacteroidales bacterium]
MKKTRLFIATILVIIIAGFLITILKRELFSKDKTSQADLYSDWGNSQELYFGFTPDSLYRIEYDTIVRIIDKRTAKTINEFHVSLSTYPEYPFLRQMEIDPSGKYVAFLDNHNIARIYNIFTGDCEGVNDYYFDGSNHIYFSDDSKYFLMVDYREATVDILTCPTLEFIADANLGYYRNYLYWENKNEKLVFYYEVGDSLYKTVFPDKEYSDSLVFSKPVAVGKVVRNTL